MRIVALLLAACCAMSATRAQLSLTAAGRLQVAPATACDPAATHALQCGAVLLRSSTLDLAPFVNHFVDVTGTPTVVTGCGITLDVTAITDAEARLSLFSLTNFRVGSTLTLLTAAPIGAIVVQFFSCYQGVLPLGPLGTYFLDVPTTLQWAFDLGLGLPLPRFVQIPNNPALVGLEPAFQAAVIDAADPLASRLSNAACFTIRS